MENNDAISAEQTSVDRAFLRAQKDQGRADAFFDALFAATLFLPVHDDFDPGAGPAPGASISPIIFEVEGETTIIVFDTEERLASFVDEPMNYIGLPGRALFEMFDGREQVAVNLNVAPSSTVLAAQSVAWLHERALEMADSVVETLPGEGLSIEGPGAVSPSAIMGLTSSLAGLSEDVTEALLFRLTSDSAADESYARLVLGIAPSETGKARAEEIARHIAEAARPLALGADSVEVAVLEPDSELMEKARRLGQSLPIVAIGARH